MLTLIVHEKGSDEPRRIRFAGPELTIGRDESNGLILDRPNISKHHLCLRLIDDRLEVSDLESTNGTYVNGRKLQHSRQLNPSDRIYLGDFVISIEVPVSPVVTASDSASAGWMGRRLHLDTVVMTSARRQAPAGYESALVDALAARVLQSVLTALRGLDPLYGEVPSASDREEASMMIEALLADLVEAGDLDPILDIAALHRRCLAEAVDLGPLTELIEDPDLIEVHAMGASSMRIVRRNREDREIESVPSQLISSRFSCDRALQLTMLRLAKRSASFVDPTRRILRGRIGDGFVVHGLLAGPGAPCIALRRATSDASSMTALVSEGVLSFAMQELLVAALHSRRRVFVVAPSGADAARFIGAAQVEVPPSARVVQIADTCPVERTLGWVVFERVDLARGESEAAAALEVVARAGFDALIVEDVGAMEAQLVTEVLSDGKAGLIAAIRGIDALHGLERLATLAFGAGASAVRLLSHLAAGIDLWVRLGSSPGQCLLCVEEIGEFIDDDGVLTARPLFRMARPNTGWIRCLPPGEVPRFVRELIDQGISFPPNFLATP